MIKSNLKMDNTISMKNAFQLTIMLNMINKKTNGSTLE